MSDNDYDEDEYEEYEYEDESEYEESEYEYEDDEGSLAGEFEYDSGSGNSYIYPWPTSSDDSWASISSDEVIHKILLKLPTYDPPDENSSEESKSDSKEPGDYSDHGSDSFCELDDKDIPPLPKESNITNTINWIDNFEWYQNNPVSIEKITSDGYKPDTEDDPKPNLTKRTSVEIVQSKEPETTEETPIVDEDTKTSPTTIDETPPTSSSPKKQDPDQEEPTTDNNDDNKTTEPPEEDNTTTEEPKQDTEPEVQEPQEEEPLSKQPEETQEPEETSNKNPKEPDNVKDLQVQEPNNGTQQKPKKPTRSNKNSGVSSKNSNVTSPTSSVTSPKSPSVNGKRKKKSTLTKEQKQEMRKKNEEKRRKEREKRKREKAEMRRRRKEKLKIRIGDKVIVKDMDHGLGIIRFRGEIEGKGIFGIELIEEEAVGDTDGTLDDKRLFECPEGKGMFVMKEFIRPYRKPIEPIVKPKRKKRHNAIMYGNIVNDLFQERIDIKRKEQREVTKKLGPRDVGRNYYHRPEWNSILEEDKSGLFDERGVSKKKKNR